LLFPLFRSDSLYDLKGTRAGYGIFCQQVWPFPTFLRMGMGIASATFWPDFIDLAGIVIIQKWAGQLVGNQVAILVGNKKFLFKIAHFHTEMVGNPQGIGPVENGWAVLQQFPHFRQSTVSKTCSCTS
jgi:hypothetical protein